mmetsp:Transcript_27513/g.50215  ORF Transcript_27513/g.50215 Transcript_27513/m.50215 type:complete len:202 (+) Transcript_27513:1101-1706(+)
MGTPSLHRAEQLAYQPSVCRLLQPRSSPCERADNIPLPRAVLLYRHGQPERSALLLSSGAMVPWPTLVLCQGVAQAPPAWSLDPRASNSAPRLQWCRPAECHAGCLLLLAAGPLHPRRLPTFRLLQQRVQQLRVQNDSAPPPLCNYQYGTSRRSAPRICSCPPQIPSPAKLRQYSAAYLPQKFPKNWHRPDHHRPLAHHQI